MFGSRTVSGILPASCPDRIEHRHDSPRSTRARRRAGPFGIHRRIAAIGRDDVVQIGLGIGPVPHRDDDVALDALRTRRRRRKLAGRDAIRPVGEAPTSIRSRPIWFIDGIMLSPACPDCEPPLPRLRRSTKTCRALRESRASPCCRAGGTPGRCRSSSDAATPPGCACSARCRCPTARSRETRLAGGALASARTSIRPGSTRPRRVGVGRDHGGEVQGRARRRLRPSANRPGRSRAPRRCI